MEIIIVGAGLAGLSTALALSHSLSGTSSKHRILLLESAAQLAEIGAGVQLTPAATRFFLRCGLGSALLAASAVPSSWHLRRGSDGEVLNRVPMDQFTEWYGAPYVVVHRADLHRILWEALVARQGKEAAVEVEMRLGTRVAEYGVEEGWVQVQRGERLKADLVIACDGINSSARGQLMQSLGAPQQEWVVGTGMAAYRVMADVKEVRADPLTREIVEEHAGNCWADTHKLVMTYMVRGSDKLNLVLSHPDTVDTSAWTQEQYKAELTRFYGDMDPRVKRLIELASGPVTNWPVHQVLPLPSWTSRANNFVLIGDAAHAMSFYLSMGVSLAIEDGLALATALAYHVSCPETFSLASAVTLFETVRKPRAEKISAASQHAGDLLHLSPGPQRDMRDRAARRDGAEGEEETRGDPLLDWTSYGITDKKIRQWVYGYDVLEEVESKKQEMSKL
ncbi:hypothetical protein GGP41_007331 [Bipolaris sorokiniana]|uniref:FAD-binding domain-containing protein n=1 Tax=Cochliobolus sativus TaxID=45130 RepID=A0A8H6E081_COCSA|nr:hypothetical protein GGP41_007331 [Bipolaris sorokiniana]